jgi:HEPN domain-containing protein
MTWRPGEAEIRSLLDQRRLEQVPPNERHAHQLLAQAEAALDVARYAAGNGHLFAAVAEAWEAARKALTAPLAWQGLRPTTDGGHQVVLDAARAQFGNVLGALLRPLPRLKRRRNEVEYPDVDVTVDPEEVAELVEQANSVVEAARQLLRPELTVFR